MKTNPHVPSGFESDDCPIVLVIGHGGEGSILPGWVLGPGKGMDEGSEIEVFDQLLCWTFEQMKIQLDGEVIGGVVQTGTVGPKL